MPVNAYRWFRGFNDYDNWQASGVSGEGARSFYYPPKPQKCADCHMPLVESNDPAAKNGMVRSHRFPAANTALPFVNGDTEQLEDRAAVPAGRADLGRHLRPGARRRSAAPARQVVPSAERGHRQHIRGGRRVDELRRAAGVHRHAGRGRRAARQGRRRRPAAANRSVSRSSSARARSVTSSRAAPSTRSTSGSSSRPSTTRAGRSSTAAQWPTTGSGPVEPGAHFYRSLLLDEHGNPINKRNAWAARSVAYVRLIPPGAADTVHYRLRSCRRTSAGRSRSAQGELPQVRVVEHAVGVRRRPRSERRGGLDRAGPRRRPLVFTGRHVEGLGGMKDIPDIPITVMARAEATLRVVPGEHCRRNRRPISTSRCASAGTTTASACCCRAISRPPRPRSSK